MPFSQNWNQTNQQTKKQITNAKTRKKPEEADRYWNRMGCKSSKTLQEEEDEILGPPSKTMDASEHAQLLVNTVRKAIEIRLGTSNVGGELKATQMITRSAEQARTGGMMYFIKVKTSKEKWPWIFCKIYEPESVTNVTPIQLRGFRKMDQEYKLVTF